jgi:hypothetical protein
LVACGADNDGNAREVTELSVACDPEAVELIVGRDSEHDRLGDAEVDPEPVTEAVDNVDGESALGESLNDVDSESVDEADGVALSDAESVTLLGLPLNVAVRPTNPELDADTLGDAEVDPEAVGEGEGDVDGVSVVVGVSLSDAVADAVGDIDSDADAERVAVRGSLGSVTGGALSISRVNDAGLVKHRADRPLLLHAHWHTPVDSLNATEEVRLGTQSASTLHAVQSWLTCALAAYSTDDTTAPVPTSRLHLAWKAASPTRSPRLVHEPSFPATRNDDDSSSFEPPCNRPTPSKPKPSGPNI